MLNIYYGSETADKSKFIFEHIKGRTLLLVPDQFSLQAEKDAFFYLGEKSLMDLIVVDFSSLGNKAVTESGGRKPAMIDKYGRHILLTRIIDEIEDELKVFRGFSWKNSFADMMNSMISEMKRYDITPEDIAEAEAGLDEGSYLKYKLHDIEKIFMSYQKRIEGKYLDSEDYITFYGEKITESRLVNGAEVWIYGFDTFTPKNLQVIEKLISTAAAVNIVMTYEPSGSTENRFSDARFLAAEDDEDLFGLTGYVISKLVQIAENLGEKVKLEAIDGELRTSVWNMADAEGPVTLAAVSDIYAEAERAAAYIMELVRDEGFRFGDIVVVCNDNEIRGNILRRTFIRWGIPVFMDRKRKVMHHPAVAFLLALMEVIAGGYKDDAVMRLIKSGLIDMTVDETELLENYVRQFRIRGNMWKKDFIRCGRKYTSEDLNVINGLRKRVVSVIENARHEVGSRNKAADKIRGLYRFLDEDFFIRERLDKIMERQNGSGFADEAAETAQSWNVICGIFDQIVETLGDERISNEGLLKLMTAGFEEMEIGIVPTSSDCVIIGTLQRTRLSRIRALVVTGANEGILPVVMKDEGLLSSREKAALESMDFEFSKKDDVARQEEKLAIYRMLSLPQEKLYMSCSATDEKGEELRPSHVFTLLREYVDSHGRSEVLGNLGSRYGVPELAVSAAGTISYVADALRNNYSDGYIDEMWLPVLKWYQCNDAVSLERVRAGVMFDNHLEKLGRDFADILYCPDKDVLQVSASRLEEYSRCPFAHFVKYGLRAEEQVPYGMGAGEIGDVYHECMMRLSRELMQDVPADTAVTDPESPWMTITREKCCKQVRHILQEEMKDFREGVMSAGPEEVYRSSRITEICENIAWLMIGQVRKGHIKHMRFEQPFGRGCSLPPIRVDAGGKEVLIQGKIDRMDIMESSDSVRVVDYKTGTDSVKVDYIRSGYKLQLMVYLKAAMKEPAGVFYFRIRDVDTDADTRKVGEGPDDFAERMADAYKLEGIVVNDMDIIEDMDGEFSSKSQVIPVKLNRSDNAYAASSGGYLFTPEEFSELCQQVDEQVKRICCEICDGSIDILPKLEKEKDMDGRQRTSCRFCEYRSICMFDTTFAGCRYHNA